MDQRISVITLGVDDVPRARDFYKALGWTVGSEPGDGDIVFFQAGGMLFSLWWRDKLAVDSCVENSGGWSGLTLSVSLPSPEDVDAVLTEAERAGARIGRPGDRTFWGGYSGIFVDPDGYPWEVAHHPALTLHDDGTVTL